MLVACGKLDQRHACTSAGLQDSESLAVSDRQRKANPAGKEDDTAGSLTIERSLTVADAVLGEHSASGAALLDLTSHDKMASMQVCL